MQGRSDTPGYRGWMEDALKSPNKVERRFDRDYPPAWDWLKRHYGEVLFEDYRLWQIPHEDLVSVRGGGPITSRASKIIIVDPSWDQDRVAEHTAERDAKYAPSDPIYPYYLCHGEMYDATHEYMHSLSAMLGDPQDEPHAEYWVTVRMTGYALEVMKETDEEVRALEPLITYRRIAIDKLDLPTVGKHWATPGAYGPDITPEQRLAADELARRWADRIVEDHSRLMTLPPPHRLPPEWVGGCYVPTLWPVP